ncbi:MAG: permease [Desulfovibrio sp.]|nr:permease [Desulfovibrio sp.]
MELLTKLFITHGAVQTTLVLSITIALGILLGRIRIFGVSFGIGGILFSGIILGHFGLSLDPKVLSFTREFGLILFVYAIGMAVGPTFVESLRDQGLKLCGMAVYVVLCGALLAAACCGVFGLSVPQTAGIFSGAVTNTPALGSANEAWSMVGGAPDVVARGLKEIGMAYAVAYPFGIFGIILTMMLLKGLFRIDVAQELASLSAARPEHHEKLDLADTVTLVVSNGAVAGRELAGLAPAEAAIRVLVRGRNDYAWNGQWRLRLDDRIIVQKGPGAEALANIVGNDAAHLDHPNMLAIFIGIFAGVFIGSIPVFVPGLPTGLRLGVAGGTLVLAIILSRVQRFAGLTWYMRPGANNLMREIGILLFMACVGLYAGTGFVETVVNGPGLRWMGIGAIITFVPLFTAALFCRAVWKINFPTICGMLAGSMTDPPALAFAMQYYGGEVAATGYSTVYPVTMILRILMGQLLVLLLIS